MEYITGAHTDIGRVRETNQDAICIMQAQTIKGNVCMAIVCDGMGGLSKGEVASATIVKAFEKGFEEKLPELLSKCSLEEIKLLWEKELLFWNKRLSDYGRKNNISLGTTFSGMLFVENRYLWMHIGDSRIYKIDNQNAEQITTDHTVVAREIANGNMTLEEAEHSKLRSKLTQCIGTAKEPQPESGIEIVRPGESFLICSDGFYHKITKEELSEVNDSLYDSEREADRFCRKTIENIMRRGEKDNISVVVIKCE